MFEMIYSHYNKVSTTGILHWALNGPDFSPMCKRSAGMVGLAPKWVRLDPKLDKSGTFSDQISGHLAHRAKCTEI